MLLRKRCLRRDLRNRILVELLGKHSDPVSCATRIDLQQIVDLDNRLLSLCRHKTRSEPHKRIHTTELYRFAGIEFRLVEF